MQTELDTTSGVARVPLVSGGLPSLNQQPRTKTLRIPLSKAAIRTSPPSITNLMQTALENPDIVSLAAGFVDQQSLPVEVSARSVSAMFASEAEGRRSLQYGTTIGHAGFRARLIERLERTEGVAEGTYQEAIARTVVTTGSAQLIYLICEALLDPGDIVLVESPTYFVFLGPVETRGARAVRVPIDDGGLRIDALERRLVQIRDDGQLDRVKLIYSIPEHANPTGISLAAERRKPLVDLARRWSDAANRRIFVLEDAAYHGLSYGVQEPHSLWSLDPDGETVILARTFSKTFSPGVKVGYGVLPRGLIDPILRLKGNHDFGSANFNQQLLERALASGDYDRHVAQLRELYGKKRDVLVAALAPSRTRSSECALDPPQRGTVRLDDCSGGGRYWIRRAAFPAVLAKRESSIAGRVCVRSRAGTGSPKPPSVDLRGSLGSRCRGRGPATGAALRRALGAVG